MACMYDENLKNIVYRMTSEITYAALSKDLILSTNSYTLDDQVDASVQKECGTKCMPADVENAWTWYKTMMEWLWSEKDDPTASAARSAVVPRKTFSEHDNECIACTMQSCHAAVGQTKELTESTVDLRKNRSGKCCLRRRCRGNLYTNRIKRRWKNTSSVHLRVSQESVINCWKIQNIKEATGTNVIKESQSIAKDSIIEINQSGNQMTSMRHDKEKTDIATGKNEQSIITSQMTEVQNAGRTEKVKGSIEDVCINTSNLKDIKKIRSFTEEQNVPNLFSRSNCQLDTKHSMLIKIKRNKSSVDNVARLSTSKYVKETNNKCSTSRINQADVKWKDSIWHNVTFTKCSDSLTSVPKFSMGAPEKRPQENFSTLEAHSTYGSRCSISHYETQEPCSSICERNTRTKFVASNRDKKPKFRSKSDSENTRRVKSYGESDIEGSTNNFFNNVSKRMQRNDSPTSCSGNASINNVECSIGTLHSYSDRRNKFQETDIKINSESYDRRISRGARGHMLAKHKKFPKNLCRCCTRPLFRSRANITNAIGTQLYKNYTYEESNSEISTDSVNDREMNSKNRQYYAPVTRIDQPKLTTFTNNKRQSKSGRSTKNSTRSPVSVSSTSSGSFVRNHNFVKDTCQCGYDRIPCSRDTYKRVKHLAPNEQSKKMYSISKTSSSSCLSSSDHCHSWRNFSYNHNFNDPGSISYTNTCLTSTLAEKSRKKWPRGTAKTVSLSSTSSSSSSSSSTSTYCKPRQSYSDQTMNSALENQSTGDDTTFDEQTDESRILKRKRASRTRKNPKMLNEHVESIYGCTSCHIERDDKLLKCKKALKEEEKMFSKRENRLDNDSQFVCIPYDNVWEKIISMPE